MLAELNALEIIEDNPPMRIRILSDSMAAILALKCLGNQKRKSRPNIIEEIATISTSLSTNEAK